MVLTITANNDQFGGGEDTLVIRNYPTNQSNKQTVVSIQDEINRLHGISDMHNIIDPDSLDIVVQDNVVYQVLLLNDGSYTLTALKQGKVLWTTEITVKDGTVV